MQRSCFHAVGAALAGVMIIPAVASANIILELRPANQTVGVGDPADLGLYAVSDNANDQLLSAADVMFTWDPTYLHLLFTYETGGPNPDADPNVLSSFFPAGDPYGNINQPTDGFGTPTSGTGFVSILAGFGGGAVHATPAGTLLTNFALDALAPTPDTIFSIILHAEGSAPHTQVGKTIVFSGEEANTDVTGSLSLAHITITPEPATAAFLLLGVVAINARRRRPVL